MLKPDVEKPKYSCDIKPAHKLYAYRQLKCKSEKKADNTSPDMIKYATGNTFNLSVGGLTVIIKKMTDNMTKEKQESHKRDIGEYPSDTVEYLCSWIDRPGKS